MFVYIIYTYIYEIIQKKVQLERITVPAERLQIIRPSARPNRSLISPYVIRPNPIDLHILVAIGIRTAWRKVLAFRPASYSRANEISSNFRHLMLYWGFSLIFNCYFRLKRYLHTCVKNGAFDSVGTIEVSDVREKTNTSY